MQDTELEQAQRVLEQKRASFKTQAPTTPKSPQDILPAILSATQTSGDDAPPEWCEKCRNIADCKIDHEECQRQTKERENNRQGKVTAALTGINIGIRYQGMAFSDYHPANDAAKKVLVICERYATTFSDRLKNCDNLLMMGNHGTGKNMLAACICQAVALQGYSAIHTTAIKLVRRIKESWSRGSELTEQKSIDQFSLPDLLVIDEVGVQYGSDTEKILLFEVINERYENMRPTIIISNLSMKDVETFLTSRIIDRFHEGKSAVLEFTWSSYRRQSCK